MVLRLVVVVLEAVKVVALTAAVRLKVGVVARLVPIELLEKRGRLEELLFLLLYLVVG